MTINKKGFGLVGALLIFVVIALIGGAGFYLRNNQMPTSAPTVNTSTSNSDTAQQATTEEMVKWLLEYTSENKKFRVLVPDGWKLTSTKDYDNLYSWSADGIQYKEGAIAEVETVEGGRDGSSIAFIMAYNDGTDVSSNFSLDAQKVKNYKTANGVTVDKFSRVQAKEPEDMDLPKGAIEYRYILSLDKKQITIVHDVLPEESEQTKLIEQMIETVKFL